MNEVVLSSLIVSQVTLHFNTGTHTRGSHSSDSSTLPTLNLHKLQSTRQNHKSIIVSLRTDHSHFRHFSPEGVLSIRSWIGEVVQPVETFVGDYQKVGWVEVDQDWLGQVPLIISFTTGRRESYSYSR